MLDETVQSRIVETIGGMVARANLTAEYRELILIPLGRPHKPFGNEPEWPWSALVVATARSAGGEQPAAAIVAAAVECALAAADVFDEIEDGDASELVDRCGAAQALNVAGGLLSLAYLTLTQVEGNSGNPSLSSLLSSTMGRFMLTAADGQHHDLAGEGARLAPDHALAVAQAKAGALGAMACRMGALLAVRDDELLGEYERFGRHLATAGQLANDLRDVDGSYGKSDVLQQKSTLPLLVRKTSVSANTQNDSFDPAGALGWVVVEYELQLARQALDRLSGLGETVGPLAKLLE